MKIGVLSLIIVVMCEVGSEAQFGNLLNPYNPISPLGLGDDDDRPSSVVEKCQSCGRKLTEKCVKALHMALTERINRKSESQAGATFDWTPTFECENTRVEREARDIVRQDLEQGFALAITCMLFIVGGILIVFTIIMFRPARFKQGEYK